MICSNFSAASPESIAVSSFFLAFFVFFSIPPWISISTPSA